MKKIIFTILVVFVALSAFSQEKLKRLNVGVRGGVGVATVFSSQTWEDDAIGYQYDRPSYWGEGRLGIMFGDYIGVSGAVGSVLYVAPYRLYTMRNEFTRKLTIPTTSFVLLFNLETSRGFFLDIGPRLHHIGAAKITNSPLGWEPYVDLKPKLKKNFVNVDFALGAASYLTDYLTLKAGFRGNYSLNNLIKDDCVLPTIGNGIYTPAYTGGKASLISFMLSVELVYTFGIVGETNDGKNRFMFTH